MKNYASLKDIQEDLVKKEISCKKLVLGYLSNISNQRDVNAFVEIYKDEALERSDKIDTKIKNNTAGSLAGLVIGIKDNICFAKHGSTAGSKILENFKSTFSATVVERLINEDAIIIGRLNCDEFAMGSSTENSIHGSTLNPINQSYVPGGSSGGSAAAVRSNMCQIALGTDTGGSVRQPSAFCGLIGLKPTYGLVSRHGLIAYASSFDQVGPIGKSTHDILEVMKVISGKDSFDSTCTADGLSDLSNRDIHSARFAVVKEAIDFPGIDPGVQQEMKKFIQALKEKGHKINYISLPLLEYLVPTYYILTTAEASSNLSRYDGIKFGHQEKHHDINELISQTRGKGFGKEVKRRIMLGTYVLSEGYYDAYYTKAQKIRRLIQQETEKILSENDFILLPTTPHLPFKLGSKSSTATQMYNEDIFTVSANLSGHPAIAFPLGEVANGFSASAQIMGNYFEEQVLLDVVEKIISK
ncbi:Asp-tRNA(Asn)/Glu-tRNA(Gln) amidotransferase subunit GatA [Flavobacteriales bacterium]|nr:Asp-tRNA(Asn)/Glu-tRNA(Gln) amidotransferase subunit GatA [Flavobacteriales bacterium]